MVDRKIGGDWICADSNPVGAKIGSPSEHDAHPGGGRLSYSLSVEKLKRGSTGVTYCGLPAVTPE